MENTLTDLLIQLTEIPASTGKEEARRNFIQNWIKKQIGEEGVVDEAGNLVYAFPADSTKSPGYLLLCAHMDTVFSDEVIYVRSKEEPASDTESSEGRRSLFQESVSDAESSEVKRSLFQEPLSHSESSVPISRKKLLAPGIGDDTANVAVLMMWMSEHAEELPGSGLLIAFDVGEEGLGNLKGMRQICRDHSEHIRECLALDLTYGVVHHRAVGSVRYELTVHTPGGHSLHDFGTDNAIALAAERIARIYKISADDRGTYNVGKISGGTSVNTIPSECTFMAEVRSSDPENLDALDKELRECLIGNDGAVIQEGTSFTLRELGRRPCGLADDKAQAILTDRAVSVISKVTGKAPVLAEGSMDYNMTLSMGIPSISFGCYEGGGYHTYDEWLYEDSLLQGLQILEQFLSPYLSVK